MGDNNCLICERINQIKEGNNPYFVKELDSGYVVLGDYQLFNGYALLLYKDHVEHLHETKPQFLSDMALLQKAVYNVFKPLRTNCEQLGNTDHHIHWHIFPRHEDDPSPKTVTWKVDKSIRYNDKYKPNKEELKSLRESLLTELNSLAS